MAHSRVILQKVWRRIKSWEGFLFAILLIVIIVNSAQSQAYLSLGNLIP